MGVAEVVLLAGIIGGAVFFVSRSMFKKKGPCAGCGSAGSCDKVKESSSEVRIP